MMHCIKQRKLKDYSSRASGTRLISTKNTPLPNFILTTDFLSNTGDPGTETTVITWQSFLVPIFLSPIGLYLFLITLILFTVGIQKSSGDRHE
jgi:hypothetical protein